MAYPQASKRQQIVDGSTKGKVTGSKVTGTAELGTVSIQGAPARGEAGGRGQAALCGSPWPLSTRPCAQVANGLEAQNCRSELHTFPASSGGPEDAQSAAFSAERARSPSALAPGYAEPLKGIPPEKFNHTAIPKGYRCPWQEFISYRDYQRDGRSHTPSLFQYRNFNKTPVPFGGPLVGETVPRAGTPFVPELISGLELLRLRPSFNRVAQGWVRNLPESEDL
ncbi:myozenin-3 isoform X4 [Ailuropoda melanoleuca]|uniref:myozenin-3 isoform X4 n=1 Tax=Ailuropoda melanoleuca TaxID=9646 RepID=UPI0014944B23|nr:myozenin-3 isoform X4 [Ailuropoda melanoleuca]